MQIPPNVQRFREESFFVTTSNRPKKELVIRAKELARLLKAPYISRRTLVQHQNPPQPDFYYVMETDRLVIRGADGSQLFFHPASAKMRHRNLKNGQEDHLINVLELRGNEQVLDLTLGLGSEAILMAGYLEQGGFVVGLEASRHLAVIVGHGLKTYRDDSPWIQQAMSRVVVEHADYKRKIRELPDDAYDIVYCDPMFESPVWESSALNAIRPFAIYDSIDLEDVDHMKRVARKKVVLKALYRDSLFDQIAVDHLTGSRHSGVLYGVIHP